MLTLRSVAVALLSFALTALALPAGADNKVFAIDASPTVAAGAGKTMTVKFSNLADGNSTFNSVTLTASASSGTLVITGASTDSAKVGTVSGLGTGAVTITDLSPTKPGKPLVVTLTVTTTANGCSAGAVNWTAQAWTGSPGTPSNYFALQPSPGNRATAITGPDCKYSLSGILSSVTPGSTNSLTVTLTNQAAAGAPALTSLVLTVPTSLKVPTQTAPTGVSIAGNVITVARNVAAGASTAFALTVEADKSCTATPAAPWNSTASPAAYTLSGAVPTTSISAPVPACSMTISAPSSGVATTPFNVTVNLINGPGSANVTLASNCSFSGSGTVQATGYSAVFGGSVPSTGTCSFTASADKGYGSAPPLTGFTVYFGILGCNTAAAPVFPPVPGPGYFASLPAGVSAVTDPGFAAGYRVANDKNDECKLVNFTFTNNILGGNSLDAAGNTLPTNAASYVWDQDAQPNAVFVYMLTFVPERVHAISGLPTRKTKFCNVSGPTDCTLAANQQVMKACVRTELSSISIPGADPACIAEETWTTVDPSLCPAWTSGGEAPACVRITNRIIDARDPPIIRGDI